MPLPPDHIYVPSFGFVRISSAALQHKEYPRCRCGRRYIEECLFCKHGRR